MSFPASATEPAPHALLAGASIEIAPRDHAGLAAACDLLPPGSAVFLPWIAGETHHLSVDAARLLARRGLEPVPHVAARFLSGYTQLGDFLARLAGEAGTRGAMLVGGDRDHPLGALDSGRTALETGLFARHGFRHLGLPAYPEGNPRIGAPALDAALRAKLALAAEQGIAARIVTQFCFEAAPILDLLRRLRAAGIAAPVRIGIAGPASLAALMKFALRCGVGNSVRALALHGAAIARLTATRDPSPVLDGLAAGFAAEPALATGGIHVFAFGGAARTALWLRGQG
jgi:methylenetetrahydrofolate reductase (NADPH)